MESNLPDVQGECDPRGIPLVVSVESVRKQITLRDITGRLQRVDANFTMSAVLGSAQRGAHMSRFLRVLKASVEGTQSPFMEQLVIAIADAMHVKAALVNVGFLYRFDRISPKSGIVFEGYIPAFLEHSRNADGCLARRSGVTVPVMTVCPCSLKLGGGVSAHSQRCEVSVVAESVGPEMVWLEWLIDSVVGSANVFSVLRREDEQQVVRDGFDKPMFVEDVARATLEKCYQKVGHLTRRIAVTAKSYESIHPHNVLAKAEWEAQEVDDDRRS